MGKTVVEREATAGVEMETGVEIGVPVVVIVAQVQVVLFAGGVAQHAFATPVERIGRRVDVGGEVAIIVGRQHQIEAIVQQIALGILERRHEGMAETILLAVDNFLTHTVLYVFVHAGQGETEQKTVGPGAIDHATAYGQGFVVVGVVETAHPFGMAEIDAPVGKVFHGSRDGIVIVGIVLEGTHFHFPSRCPSAVPIERALVRVERAAGVGSVDVPARLWSLGDDVDDSTDGIGAESDGDNAFVDLDALGKIDGDIIESEGAAHPFLGHSVDKDLNVLATEAVERDVHVRTHATGFAHFHTRCRAQRLAEGLGGVLQRARVDSDGVVGGMAQATEPTGGDFHFVKAVFERREAEVECDHAVGCRLQDLCELPIADGRSGKGACAFKMRKTIDPRRVTHCVSAHSSHRDHGFRHRTSLHVENATTYFTIAGGLGNGCAEEGGKQ